MNIETRSRGSGARDIARIFKALGEPNRLAIFQLIRERGAKAYTDPELDNSVSKLAESFDLSLSTVSHHLKELREAGLIRCERRGQTILCTPDPEILEEIEGFLKGSREE